MRFYLETKESERVYAGKHMYLAYMIVKIKEVKEDEAMIVDDTGIEQWVDVYALSDAPQGVAYGNYH